MDYSLLRARPGHLELCFRGGHSGGGTIAASESRLFCGAGRGGTGPCAADRCRPADKSGLGARDQTLVRIGGADAFPGHEDADGHLDAVLGSQRILETGDELEMPGRLETVEPGVPVTVRDLTRGIQLLLTHPLGEHEVALLKAGGILGQVMPEREA